MLMLDGLRDIFLKALSYVPVDRSEILIDAWNKECENVYKYKQSIVAKENTKFLRRREQR